MWDFRLFDEDWVSKSGTPAVEGKCEDPILAFGNYSVALHLAAKRKSAGGEGSDVGRLASFRRRLRSAVGRSTDGDDVSAPDERPAVTRGFQARSGRSSRTSETCSFTHIGMLLRSGRTPAGLRAEGRSP